MTNKSAPASPISPQQRQKLREEAARLTEELRRRGKATWLDYQFKEQLDFILDPAKLKVALCTRRAGKSYAAGCYLFKVASEIPNCSVLYLALTRESARGILWRDVIKSIDREHNIGCEFRENALTATLPNGSCIYLLGADSSDDEKSKLLGRKFALVVIDEAASFTTDLTELVYGTLKPSVADFRGTVCLIGTPSNLRSGLFYELTQGQDPSDAGTWTTKGWSGHRWNTFHNPHMASKWALEIEELVAANPRVKETPWFTQNYLGVWSTDDDKRVYRYVRGRNDYDVLPDYRDFPGSWHYVLGVDLGYQDDTSFAIAAYHDVDQCLYFIDVEKQPKLDVTDVALRIKSLSSRYDFDSMVIDGSARQAVEELRKRHGLPLQAAEKQGKAEFIDLMNAEYLKGTIKLGPRAQPLRDEYDLLVWDERALKRPKNPRREEHPACPNHASDAALYAWRHCIPYLAQKAEARVKPGSAAWYDVEAKRMERREVERVEALLREDSGPNIWEDLEWQ